MSIPIGARVHHRSCKSNKGFTEEQRRENPSRYWGTVIEVVDHGKGRYEYRVKKDADYFPGSVEVSWWYGYEIDRWEVLS